MGILDQIAGKGLSPLEIVQSGTQGQMDAYKLQGASQALQMKSLQMQMESEANVIKKRSRKVMENANLGTIQGTRDAAQKALESGDVELGRQLDKSADDEQYRADKMKLDREKLDALLASYKAKSDAASKKVGQSTKFKKASIGEFKSTGALMVNTPDFDGLEDKHKTTYAGAVTQAVSDYMEASRSAGAPVTRLQALQAVQSVAASYVQEEGTLFGFKNPADKNKFDQETFISDFNQMLPSLLGYSEGAIATAEGITIPKEKDRSDTNAFLDSIIGE